MRAARIVGYVVFFSEFVTDGPQVEVTLPDRQVVLATVLRRRREPGRAGGWWYEVEMPLWGAERGANGVARAVPVPVKCWAPAEVCTALDGEDYEAVPTSASGRAFWWVIEQSEEDRLVVHRGDCAAAVGQVHPARAEAVHRALATGAVRCPVCAPPIP
ncbi:DUF6233 domain-containing protein [Streptomyces xiamenensis]|uniref:DUF6233 domain-containing protein n=1 Tax=Streptomyces xiamenensis TaxID=408015 RepID=UPI0035E21ED0